MAGRELPAGRLSGDATGVYAGRESSFTVVAAGSRPTKKPGKVAGGIETEASMDGGIHGRRIFDCCL